MTIPELKFYYREIMIKIAWNLYRSRNVHQWNQDTDLKWNLQNSGHLIFGKIPKPYNGKGKAYSTNGTGNLDIHLYKNEKRSILITLYETVLQVDAGYQHKTGYIISVQVKLRKTIGI